MKKKKRFALRFSGVSFFYLVDIVGGNGKFCYFCDGYNNAGNYVNVIPLYEPLHFYGNNKNHFRPFEAVFFCL